MGDTKIEWATKRWNPVTGCSHTGFPRCDNCYARRMANRLRGRFGYPADEPFRPTFHPDRLEAPAKWWRERVFVDSMGDLFHPDVKREWIDAVFNAMWRFADKSENTFIVLTGRPRRMAEYVLNMRNRDDAPMPWGEVPRIHLGVSIANQADAGREIRQLLRIKGFTLIVSVEPMLGPVDLTKIAGGEDGAGWRFHLDALAGGLWEARGRSEKYTLAKDTPRLGQVICGGETGPGARPVHPEWPRSLRDQCQAAGVPFFMKQMSKKAAIPDDLMVRQFPNAER